MELIKLASIFKGRQKFIIYHVIIKLLEKFVKNLKVRIHYFTKTFIRLSLNVKLKDVIKVKLDDFIFMFIRRYKHFNSIVNKRLLIH